MYPLMYMIIQEYVIHRISVQMKKMEVIFGIDGEQLLLENVHKIFLITQQTKLIRVVIHMVVKLIKAH